MKTIINKLRYTLLLGFFALAALGTSLTAAAETLTVCDVNTTANDYVPVYGLYYDDNYQISQMIYPESLLTNMRGGVINSLTFYANSDITLTGGSFTIRLGTTNLSSFGSATRITTGMTAVATSNMTACRNGSQLVITFTTPYNYTSGNLVVEFQSTTTGSSWQSLKFHGVTSYSNSSIYGRNNSSTPSSFTLQSFLPKATFEYESATTNPTISANPLTIDFEAIPGGSSSKTVTVRGRNLTGNINVSSPSGGIFSVSPSSFTPSNGIVDNEQLTITYTPSEVGTHSAIVTLSSAGADPVTITLNGSCDWKATICDGTDKNGNLPIYGYYIDNYQINQMIYPESLLSDLIGKDLTSMTFYTEGSIHPDLETSTWTIKLGTTDETVFASSLANSTRLVPNDITTVTPEQGYIVTSGINTMTIVFDTPFPYNGGNLLVDFQSTAHTSDYEATNFYGVNQNSNHNTGFHSYGSSATPGDNGHYTGGNVDAFLPKVTFTYEESTPITDGTVTPDAVDFGTVVVGETATQTVAIKNTGNQPFTPVIDVTGLPEGITVSPTTSGELAGHQTLNLTVIFTPTAEGNYSGSFTVTIPIPDGEDLVFTVDVTGSAYVISSTLTSNTVEVPVYKSEAKADGTYIFSKDDVDGDTDMSLSYGTSGINVEVLVKNEEPVVRYDLHKKEGDNGTWTYPNGTAVATATQDSSNPKSYTVGQETFTIPSDATEMWVPMAATGVDASTTYFVPVTYANGIVTTGNTYGAPQIQATTVSLTPTLSIGGSKSAGRPGGHWTQSINGTDVDYCVYTPVISISPVYPEGAVPYLVRAWLLENEEIPFFTVTRVANANDNNTHIEGGAELTYPHPLGEMELSSEMIGGPLTIGYDWTEDNAGSAGSTIQPNAFAAPSEMSQGEISIAVRVYYYKADATQSGQKALRDGSEAPADGYGYGEGNGSDEGIPTAVSNIYTDRQVVDVKYVNTIGMQSDKPFDGVNIVVTRYSDGSITTTKVLK